MLIEQAMTCPGCSSFKANNKFCAYTGQKLAQLGEKIAQACLPRLALFPSLWSTTLIPPSWVFFPHFSTHNYHRLSSSSWWWWRWWWWWWGCQRKTQGRKSKDIKEGSACLWQNYCCGTLEHSAVEHLLLWNNTSLTLWNTLLWNTEVHKQPNTKCDTLLKNTSVSVRTSSYMVQCSTDLNMMMSSLTPGEIKRRGENVKAVTSDSSWGSYQRDNPRPERQDWGIGILGGASRENPTQGGPCCRMHQYRSDYRLSFHLCFQFTRQAYRFFFVTLLQVQASQEAWTEW